MQPSSTPKLSSTLHLTDAAHVDGLALDQRYLDARAADLELSERLGLELLEGA